MRLIAHNNLWNTTYSNFSPKLGFAWTPASSKQNFVFRGGFAVAYNHLDIALFNNALEDGPNIASFGLCCGTNAADFSTPFDGGAIKYEEGTSNSPNSFPINPGLATGVNASGFPNPFGGGTQQVEVYGALPATRSPMVYLYSWEPNSNFPGSLWPRWALRAARAATLRAW